MNTSQITRERAAAGGTGDRLLTAATYLMLILFGAAQSLLGAFFYGSGPAPVASLGFDLVLFASCLLGAWGLRRPVGAFAPAVGWFVGAFILASATASGSVLVTASVAGETFLFGGAAAAMLGLLTAFVVASRRGIGATGAGIAGAAGGKGAGQVNGVNRRKPR
ncbi:MAG: hypothetical protein ACYCVZ_10845 [Streptosporangiaceae bacterium]